MQTFGKYEVIRKLPGEPESYLARVPGLQVCILRRIGPVGPDALEQALSAVRLCASLGHPAIGQVFDALVDGEHLLVATPEPEGSTALVLISRLRQDGIAIDPAAAWYLGHVAAGALGAAHTASVGDDFVTVSHGCLSPEWIAIDWDGTVRVDGLGLAALIEVQGMRAELGYCAPEQRQGRKVTPRGDLYSLAAIVWALLAGQTPPAEPRIDAIAANIPESLRELFARALEPSLGKRKVTAAELEHAFGEVAGANGQKALANALATVRKGTSLQGTPRVQMPISPRPGPVLREGVAATPPAVAAAREIVTSKTPVAGVPRVAAVITPRAGTTSHGGPLPPRPKLPSSSGEKGTTPTPSPTGSPTASPGGARPNFARAGSIGGGAEKAAPPKRPIDDELSWGSDEEIDNALEAIKPTEPISPVISEGAAPRPQASAEDVAPKETDEAPKGLAKDEAPKDATKDELAASQAIDRAVDDILADESPSWTDRSVPPIESLSALQGPSSLRSDPPGPPDKPVELVQGPSTGNEPLTLEKPKLDVEGQASALSSASSQPPPSEPPVSSPPSGRDAGTNEAPPSQPASQSSASQGSPWTGETPREAVKPSLWKAIALASVTALSVFGVGVWWLTREHKITEPTAPPPASAKASSASASASATGSVFVATATPSTASPETSATPTASATTEPTASASTSADVPPPATDDSSALPSNQAHITVSFSGESGGEVFFFANSVGKVGDKLTVSCEKAVFMRIGKRNAPTDPPRWLTKGRTLKVECQKHSELRVAPD
jgi:hypothetical protein